MDSPAWVTHDPGSAQMPNCCWGFAAGELHARSGSGGPEFLQFHSRTPVTQQSGFRVAHRNHRRPIDVADSRLMAASVQGPRATEAHTDLWIVGGERP